MNHKTNIKVGIVLSIIALPILAYFIMRGATNLLPADDTVGAMGGLLMIGFIIIGLSVPYWMLKLLSKKEHMENNSEKELYLRDLPKDKNQILRDHSQRVR